MEITSISFIVFLGISVLLYYIVPKKYRWIELLIASLFFFLLTSYKVVIYFIIGVISSYIGARLIERKAETDKRKKTYLITVLGIQIVQLFILKYFNIIPNIVNPLAELFNISTPIGEINLIVPLGISYYTLSIIGYLIDVYRGTIVAEKNVFKYTLFVCYYPCLISGPIVRYKQISEQLFKEKTIEWSNIYKGFHRLIYGLLKKLVIANNIAKVVEIFTTTTPALSGRYIIYSAILFGIQLYCDFSGCMDIVIGASKMYGIELPENFKSPVFSKTMPEFWRRWHITLGEWGRDYIMYPLLKLDSFQNIAKKLKEKYGKKVSKKVPIILSTLVLWTIIGLWHGTNYKYIFGAGILPWIYLTFSEIFSGYIEKINNKVKLKKKYIVLRILQSMRTMLLMCITWIFWVYSSLKEGALALINIFVPSNVSMVEAILPINFEKSYILVSMVILALISVFVVDYLKYKEKDVGELFNKTPIIIRWGILFLVIGIIVIFGVYGVEYNAAGFIYGR